MSERQYVEFEIIKEPWNKYEVSDGTVIKVRLILTKVERTMRDGAPSYKADTTPLIIPYIETSLRGEPGADGYSQNDISGSMDKRDMRVNTIAQEFNEYVLDDGSKIKIYSNLTNVDRSRLRDGKGDPIYNVRVTHNAETSVSEMYNPRFR